MKKILVVAAISTFMLFSCNKKENTTPTENTTAVEPLTDAERFEAKVVSAENGEWFVIKNGKRWIPVSEQATNDFLKSVENGEENVFKNIPLKTLEQFPISGQILPNLEFKEQDPFELYEAKVVVAADTGEWFVIKDGKRWRTVSDEATTDFLKSVENGHENVVKNVPLSELEQFPIAGNLLPKLNFQKTTAK